MRRIVATFLALLFLSLLQGCMYYYKVQTANKVTSQGFKVYNSLDKYFILHQGDSAWQLSKVGITDNTLTGDLTVLPGNRYKFRTTKPTGGNRYKNTKKNDESYVLDEVHLYLQDSLVPKQHPGNNIPIAFSSIKKAEVYKKAKGRTNASWLIPSIGGPVLVGGILGAIIGISINQNGIGGGISMSGK
ncbi:MAG: hypothetical protein ABSE72_08250 [Bacteroidales bacterium]